MTYDIWNVMSCHIVLYHIISYYIISYHVMSCHINFLWNATFVKRVFVKRVLWNTAFVKRVFVKRGIPIGSTLRFPEFFFSETHFSKKFTPFIGVCQLSWLCCSVLGLRSELTPQRSDHFFSLCIFGCWILIGNSKNLSSLFSRILKSKVKKKFNLVETYIWLYKYNI